MDSTKQKQ